MKDNYVPTVIHKIWFNFKGNEEGELPISLFNKQSKCEFMNPNYKLKVWHEDEAEKLIREVYPQYLSLWHSYQSSGMPIKKVDALKYLIMHHEGGIYMDMDIECLNPFGDYFSENKVYLIEETTQISPYKFNNFMLASPKGHPFWLAVFRELEESQDNMSGFDIMHILESTGPGVIQRAYNKYVSVNGSDDFHILPKELFNPCDVCGNMLDNANSAYLIHESNVSWSDTAKILAFILCNKTIIILIVLLIIFWLVYSE